MDVKRNQAFATFEKGRNGAGMMTVFSDVLRHELLMLLFGIVGAFTVSLYITEMKPEGMWSWTGVSLLLFTSIAAIVYSSDSITDYVTNQGKFLPMKKKASRDFMKIKNVIRRMVPSVNRSPSKYAETDHTKKVLEKTFEPRDGKTIPDEFDADAALKELLESISSHTNVPTDEDCNIEIELVPPTEDMPNTFSSGVGMLETEVGEKENDVKRGTSAGYLDELASKIFSQHIEEKTPKKMRPIRKNEVNVYRRIADFDDTMLMQFDVEHGHFYLVQKAEYKPDFLVELECPSCGHTVDMSADSCPRCGIVFVDGQESIYLNDLFENSVMRDLTQVRFIKMDFEAGNVLVYQGHPKKDMFDLKKAELTTI